MSAGVKGKNFPWAHVPKDPDLQVLEYKPLAVDMAGAAMPSAIGIEMALQVATLDEVRGTALLLKFIGHMGIGIHMDAANTRQLGQAMVRLADEIDSGKVKEGKTVQ